MFFSNKTLDWLVVFLGNPGEQYRDTRHNVGFLTADVLAEERRISIKRAKFSALTGVCTIGGKKVMLMLPQTYMNRSGDAVYMAARSYKVPPEHILVVADDTSLDPGRLRIRRRGSAGGHNGLKSIIMRLGSEDFPRIKIGVGGPPHMDFDLADWVLGKPKGRELEAVQSAIGEAAQAVELVITAGIEAAQEKFN
ncbi:MAG: aminoacyl-tRNA hydrolase [Oscillospiraceae bacterium]|nr:aminoacyl-tRNA hydrolase [Oscillospiraceae bacterium]